MLYIKTVDEAGQPIDSVTMQTVQDAMVDVATTWAGGRFGLLGVERGTETREGELGWLTVKWLSIDAGSFCGTALVGRDGGWIALHYLHAACACGGSRIGPRTARHELGHAFGYWHTDGGSDVMSKRGRCLDQLPSAREVYHAELAYQSPVGSLDTALANASPSMPDFRPPPVVPVVVD